MNFDGINNNATGITNNSLLLQKFLNGDVDLRSIEQRDLRVFTFIFFFFVFFSFFFVFIIKVKHFFHFIFYFKRLLSELETKYKAAMITNSSMYNEKQALRYQVDTFKDILDEHYETLNQVKRQLKEKCKVKH